MDTNEQSQSANKEEKSQSASDERQSQSASDEMFIYLGTIHKCHVFTHTQMTEMTEKGIFEMTGQVYNAMIENQMIKNDEQVVVSNIFPLEPMRELITVCTHTSFNVPEPSSHEIRHIFRIATHRDRSRFVTIHCFKVLLENQKVKMVLSYQIPMTLEIKKILGTDSGPPANEKILYGKTFKPIPYL